MTHFTPAEILKGDCLETLPTIAPKTVQTCVTSPPYYGLRDYGVDGQIGLEQTPEEYIAKLVAAFRLVRDALKDDGTLWLNLGDSYAREGGTKKTTRHWDGRERDPGKDWKQFKNLASEIGAKPKDLLMIPARVALALQADGWYLRSEIIWHKPNPMPESVKDRPTKAHEMIYLLAKSQKYYYDAEAIKEPSVDKESYKGRRPRNAGQMDGVDPQNYKMHGSVKDGKLKSGQTYETRNRRDVWTVTTKPYKGAHFATFPPDLIEPCILAGSRKGDIVLDPFNGSGTTGAVALKHGRGYIGCELNEEYIKLTYERLAKVQVAL